MVSKLLGAGAAVAVIVLAVVLLRGDDNSYVVKVRFKDSDGLRVHSDVKIGGVPGGEIASLKLLPGDIAEATVHLKKGAAPIGEGASARVRPVNLLGEKYVDLRPGNLTQKMPSGSVISQTRTGGPVELDDVFNMLDSSTRARLRILINESGIGLDGRGADFNSLLANLPPALDDTKKLLDEIRGQTAELKSAIGKGDTDLATIVAKRKDLGRLVDGAEGALQAAADRRADLGTIVAAAPSVIGQLRNTLADLKVTAGRLIPTSKNLLSASAPLASTLQQLPQFVNDAKPTLRTATAVSSDLGRLGLKAAPIVRRLRPTASKLADFAQKSDPLINTLDQQHGLDALYGLFNGWDKTIQTRDGLGHVFRLRPIVDEEVLTHALVAYAPDGILNKLPKGKSKSKGKKSTAPSAPATQAPAAKKPEIKLPKIDLPSVLKPVTGAVDGIVGTLQGVLTGKAATSGATRDSGDSSRLLDYLLGGS